MSFIVGHLLSSSFNCSIISFCIGLIIGILCSGSVVRIPSFYIILHYVIFWTDILLQLQPCNQVVASPCLFQMCKDICIVPLPWLKMIKQIGTDITFGVAKWSTIFAVANDIADNVVAKAWCLMRFTRRLCVAGYHLGIILAWVRANLHVVLDVVLIYIDI